MYKWLWHLRALCCCDSGVNIQQAGLYTIYGSLDTDLSMSAVLDVLTDYGGLARIYNNIEESQLVFQGAQKQVHQVKALYFSTQVLRYECCG